MANDWQTVANQRKEKQKDFHEINLESYKSIYSILI